MSSNKRRVIALGFFDGVHLGHQALMKRTSERARALETAPAVVSFDNHPGGVVRGEAVPLLSSVADRKGLISRIGGIDDVIILHFDRHFMHMPWQDFLNTVRDELGAVHLVIGSDFSCGWKGEGTSDKVAAWCGAHDMGCDVLEDVMLDGHVISSTYIREIVAAGDMERAARYLGHPHTLTDTVGYGCRIGRTIGAPTINIRIPDGVVVPKYGVYVTRVWLAEGPKPAVTNVGVRPTFGGDEDVTVEANILDFEGSLYGSQVRLEFLNFQRAERKFPSPQALAAQIQQDIQETRAYFDRAGERFSL